MEAPGGGRARGRGEMLSASLPHRGQDRMLSPGALSPAAKAVWVLGGFLWLQRLKTEGTRSPACIWKYLLMLLAVPGATSVCSSHLETQGAVENLKHHLSFNAFFFPGHPIHRVVSHAVWRSNIPRIIKYPELEGMHEDHRAQYRRHDVCYQPLNDLKNKTK